MPSSCTGVIWGDGSSSLEAGATHTYESHGTYTITAKWVFNSYEFYKCNPIGSSQLVPIIDISRFASVPEGTNGDRTFYHLAATSLDLSTLEVENYNSLERFFYCCKNLTSLDLSNFNTSNVTNMSYMFYGCENLTSINLSSFDTSNVTHMNQMFYGCYNLTSLDLSNFNTSKLTNIIGMFHYCRKLTYVTISLKEDRSYNFYCFFGNCVSLENFDFNCKPIASNINNMFGYIQATDDQLTAWLSKLDLSQVKCLSAFRGNKLVSGSFITNLVKEYNNTITDLQYLFEGTSVKTLDLSDFDTSNVTNISGMFQECDLIELDLSNFNTSNVTNMSYMFSYCNKLTSINLSSFDTRKVNDLSYMFNNCNALATLDLSNFDVVNVTNLAYMFNNCYALTNLNPPRNIRSSLSFEKSESLTYDSLIAIINNLVEVQAAATLTLSSININKLSIEDIAIATDKNWTVV